MNRLPSDVVRFGSLLVYRPGPPRKDDNQETRRARSVTVDGLKYGRRSLPERIAGYVSRRWQEGLFRDFLGPEVVVVPVPGHAPIRGSDRRVWPIRDLATKLEQYRLGRQCDWLRRTAGVPKSAFAPPGERPTSSDHYETIELCRETPLLCPTRITVLDDVITTGATLHACVRIVRNAFPDADILAFAVVRALGKVDQIDNIIDPVEDGTITLHLNGKTSRTH